jgi:hypothetical protein
MGCRSDVISLGVAVIAHPVSTPCNRFLDDGFPKLMLINKQKSSLNPSLLGSDYTIPE